MTEHVRRYPGEGVNNMVARLKEWGGITLWWDDYYNWNLGLTKDETSFVVRLSEKHFFYERTLPLPQFEVSFDMMREILAIRDRHQAAAVAEISQVVSGMDMKLPAEHNKSQ